MGFFSASESFEKKPVPEWIEVGQIVNAHGVHGEVKVQPWDITAQQLCSLKTFYLEGTPFRPISKRIQKDMVLMKLPEIDDMDAALALKGKLLHVKAGEAKLPNGELFDAELIGMQVYEFFPRRLVGTLEEVLTYPAHKLYRVRGQNKTYLIPAVPDIFIIDTNLEKREIYVKMMEGLAIDEN